MLQWKIILNSCQAKLSRRIVYWVFASILVIEGIILIPSVVKRRQELLKQLKDVTSGKIAWIIMSYPQASPEKLLTEIKELQQQSMIDKIVGGALYLGNGQLVGTFGEKPELSFTQVNQNQILSLSSKQPLRQDFAWFGSDLPSGYTLILRYHTANLHQELLNYIIRILILVILISLFVTSVTMFVLSATVIVPVLRLRDDLINAGEALSKNGNSNQNYDFYSFSMSRKDELGEVMQAFEEMFKRVSWEIKQRQEVESILREEKDKSESLLLNILPHAIAQRLKTETNCIADSFTEVTIIFADMVGFTELSQIISPKELVNLLNDIFSVFDNLTEKYGLEKIKTIGDAYMVASGLPQPRPDHAAAAADMALEMLQEVTNFNLKNKQSLSIRIGINTGAVIAGVIGKKKFIYDLWGDAVNTASRMESHGIPGAIQVTDTTYNYLQNDYLLEERGIVNVKGKGEMLTYLLLKKN